MRTLRRRLPSPATSCRRPIAATVGGQSPAASEYHEHRSHRETHRPARPAVAGVARDHFWVLAFGLVLSVALMGIASTYVARLLDRHFWISWVGLGIITFVALRMIWEGSNEIINQASALTLPRF